MSLAENNVSNEIVVASEGLEALEYLFGTGRHAAGRDPREVRQPVDFGRFVAQVQRLQVYWLLVHEPPQGRK